MAQSIHQQPKTKDPAETAWNQYPLLKRECIESSRHSSRQVNNLSFAYRIDGAIDIPRFEKVFLASMKIYEYVRTGFFKVDGMPTQVILPGPLVHMKIREMGAEEEAAKEREATKTAGILEPYKYYLARDYSSFILFHTD